MQFKNLFLFSLVSSVFAQQALIDGFKKVDTTLDTLDQAVAALSGGDAAAAAKDLTTKSEAVQASIKDASSSISSGPELTVAQASTILGPAKHLQQTTKKTIDDLIAKKDLIAKSGQLQLLKDQLSAQQNAAKEFSAAVVAKVPAAAKPIAQNQADAINKEISRGVAAFA